MPLRVEEDFGMANRIGMGPRQIGGGKIVEILLAMEHAHPLIINVEKILEVREGVGGAYVLDACEGDRDGVALREGKHQFGFERAFDMKVKLGLRQRGDKGGAIVGRRKAVRHRTCPPRAG